MSGKLLPSASLLAAEHFSQDRSGYYVGAGVGWEFNPNWIVGVQYRHDDFGTTRSAPLGAAGVPATADTTDLSLRSGFG